MIGHGSDKKSCSVYKLFNTFAAQLQVAGNPHGFQSFEVAALGGALLPGLQFQPHSCNSHRSLREINNSEKKIDKRRSKLCSLREDPFWNVLCPYGHCPKGGGGVNFFSTFARLGNKLQKGGFPKVVSARIYPSKSKINS